MNSRLLHYFVKKNSNVVRGGYLRFKPQYVSQFPLAPEENSDSIVKLVKDQIEKSTSLNQKIIMFIGRVTSNFNLNNTSKKLNSFYELEFNQFIKEITRLGEEKISLDKQDELEDYFIKYRESILDLKRQIDKTDEEINQMVYKLYRLNKEEIAIVEKSLRN